MVHDAANGGPFRRLEKFEDGKRILLDEVKEGYDTGHGYKLQFMAIGDQISVWLDGEKVLEAKDQTFKSGKIGFMSYATDSLAIRNVRVKTSTGVPSDLSELSEPFEVRSFRMSDPTATTVKLTWSGDASKAKMYFYEKGKEDNKTPISLSEKALNEAKFILTNLEPYTDYYVDA
jgi:hypothetical protein